MCGNTPLSDNLNKKPNLVRLCVNTPLSDNLNKKPNLVNMCGNTPLSDSLNKKPNLSQPVFSVVFTISSSCTSDSPL